MENFVVSARKFRPQTFSSVVGQSHVTHTLKNAIARSQLAHAYLFTGPRGVGKTSCARIFARAINCLNPLPDHEACGECESCVAFIKDRSFNIHELDAASNNSVDDIRALTEKVRIAPQIGKYSIYIIDEVHMLSTAAFNAFLKTLEEPPHYAIFILATTEKHKILPTILSRCQVYDFNRIRIEDMVEYLKYVAGQQGVTYDEESLHMIAQKADGGMRDALSTFDRVVSFCGNNLVAEQVAENIGALDFNTYFKAVDYALAGNFADLLLLLDEILKKGFDAQLFIAGLCEHLRSLLVAKNPQTASLLEATEALCGQYIAQAGSADFEFLFNAINMLTQADTTYKNATNRRLHVELALIKLCALKKKEPIAERYPMPAINVAKGVIAAAHTPVESKESSGNLQGEPNVTKSVRDGSVVGGGSHGISSGDSGKTVSPKESPSSLEQSGDSGKTVSPKESPSSLEQSGDSGKTVSPKESPSSSGQSGDSGKTVSPKESPSSSEQSGDSGKTVCATDSPALSNQRMNSDKIVDPKKPESQAKSPARKSITGISLNGNQSKPAVESDAGNEAMDPVVAHLPEEAAHLIQQNYGQLIKIWYGRNRPRIASALEVYKVDGNKIIVAVPDEVQQLELNQAKWEIERDVYDITGGVRSTLEVIVKFVEQAYKPITIEQKYQFLVDINPEILELHKQLDLTI